MKAKQSNAERAVTETETMLPPPSPVRLHFQKYGAAATPNRTVIILHGLFGSGVNWRTIAQQLSNAYQVFCVDLRNHGQSPWHDDMRYPAMAADVARFIADHQLHGAALLGHSLGGKVAMWLAQQASEPGARGELAEIDLAKLIVVDIAPQAYHPTCHLQLLAAMRAVDFATLTSRRQIDAALASESEFASGIADPATRQFLNQNLTKGAHGYRWKINLAAIWRNMEALSGYANRQVSDLNALFIAGANSDYLSAASRAQIVRYFPNASLTTIADAGHWLHVQQPSRLVALCNSFLAA